MRTALRSAAIAAALLAMARAMAAGQGGGTYHFAGAPETSWAGFARETFARAGLGRMQVEDIASAAYPTPAARPLNSRLDCATLETVFAIPRPDWRKGMNDILSDLGVAT